MNTMIEHRRLHWIVCEVTANARDFLSLVAHNNCIDQKWESTTFCSKVGWKDLNVHHNTFDYKYTGGKIAWRVLWHAFQHSSIVNIFAVDSDRGPPFSVNWTVTDCGLTAVFGPLFLVERQCVIAPACITGSETQTKHRTFRQTQILRRFLDDFWLKHKIF